MMVEKKKVSPKKETKKQDVKRETAAPKEVKKTAAAAAAPAVKTVQHPVPPPNRMHVSVSSSVTAVPTSPGRWISLPYRNMQKPSRM